MRIIFAFIFILLCMLALLFQALRLQVIPNQKLVELANNQYKGEIQLNPKRGEIYDRNGIPLAVSVEVDSVYAVPRLVKEKVKTARALSVALDVDYSKVLKSISNDRYFAWIKRFLSDNEAAKIQPIVKHISGISTVKESKRIYPGNSTASHILGFVTIDSNGMGGIEGYYDSYLKGSQKKVKYEKDARGRPIYLNNNIFSLDYCGNSLYLTIDSALQYQVENELAEAVKKWNATSGIVIIMEPHTGEILTMANYPTYDSNNPGEYNVADLRNRSVTDLFEPGSTFKIVTMGLALKNKIVDGKTKIWGENGILKIGQGKAAKTIKEAKGHDYGMMNISDIIAKSSNVGTAKVGIMLGGNKFIAGLEELGITERTLVDLPGEVRTMYKSNPNEFTLATMAFGQGLALTPIQLARIYSIIANGGYDVNPYIVKKILSEENETIFAGSDVERVQILETNLTKQLANMLRMVVEEGTATATNIEGFEVGGKTGTAQKANPNGGGYLPDKYVASFVGFFPVSNPKYTVLVIIDEPKGNYYATSVAVPLFRKVVNLLIQNQSIAPKVLVKTDEAKKELVEKNVIAEAPVLGIKSIKYDDKIPELKGMSLRGAIHLLANTDKEIRVIGSGRVIKQMPSAGDLASNSKTVTIWLE